MPPSASTKPRRAGRPHPRVRMPSAAAASSGSSSRDQTPPRIEELDDDSDDSSTVEPSYYPFNPANPYVPPNMLPAPPQIYTLFPVLRDALETPTSVAQEETVRKVLPHLANREDPLPRLNRAAHVRYLRRALRDSLPYYMVALDASRPWIVYWCIAALALLGEDVSMFRDRVASTFAPAQNVGGGYGGGHGQFSHVAGTYAAVLSMLTVHPALLDAVNRPRMLAWLHSIKNADGSFSVAVGGEADVRGVYCALTVVSLLQLPTHGRLLARTGEYLLSCQTYEGGFAASPGGNEAHGGYAFCALAALAILYPPAEWGARVDLPALLRWLSARQYAPEGGLSGRTNKLVDGCYSTWVGGCWALVEAAINALAATPATHHHRLTAPLWDREGLARYILCATQAPRGGFRDKPGMSSDFYHSLYVLLGLSSTQHYFYYEEPEALPDGAPAEAEADGLPPTTPFHWKVATRIPGLDPIIQGWPNWPDMENDEEEWTDADAAADEGDRLSPQHPIFNVPMHRVQELVESWKR